MSQKWVGVLCLGLGTLAVVTWAWHRERRAIRSRKKICSGEIVAYTGLVGETRIIELTRLSAVTKCRILVKMESMNPGGTGKDRAAKALLEDAKSHRNYRPGVDIVEGTSGSTGISLACQCRALGYQLHVVMPDDQSQDKINLLKKLGANVVVVPTCGISNKNHYVNAARDLAEKLKGIFVNQFENLANYQIHLHETGPELWEQTGGAIDSFVMSAGTGGTIAGVSRFLKQQNEKIRVVLADPVGSSLSHRAKFGVCFSKEQTERKIRKHRYDSIVEGVGLDRVTKNFELALIDDAETVSDQEVLNMAHWLLREEGLFVGSSSALNVVVACREAIKSGPGRCIVTIVCDSGHRHLSRFWNEEFIVQSAVDGLYGGLVWPDPMAPTNSLLPACCKV